MKHAFKLKSLALSMAIAGSSVAVLAPATAQAELTGNIGLVSQYIFRGAPQSGGIAAQAGLDYEHESGFYVGLWASDVDDKAAGTNELEYDIYAGYETEVSGVTLGAGFTLYRYTKDVFDDDYNELNLWAGFGGFGLTFDTGVNKSGGDDISYNVITASYEMGGAYALYGAGTDFLGKGTDHTWIELGYSTEIAPGTDLSFALIESSKEANAGPKGNGNTSMVVGITKSFDLM